MVLLHAEKSRNHLEIYCFPKVKCIDLGDAEIRDCERVREVSVSQRCGGAELHTRTLIRARCSHSAMTIQHMNLGPQGHRSHTGEGQGVSTVEWTLKFVRKLTLRTMVSIQNDI